MSIELGYRRSIVVAFLLFGAVTPNLGAAMFVLPEPSLHIKGMIRLHEKD